MTANQTNTQFHAADKKDNNEVDTLKFNIVKHNMGPAEIFSHLNKIIHLHPELTESCLDFMKDNLLKKGHPDKYAVHPVLETLYEATQNRPDLSEKIFPRFDDLKQMYENEQQAYRTPETLNYIYACLKNIIANQSDLAPQAIEKFTDFIKSPTNNEQNLEKASDELYELALRKPQIIDIISEKICPEFKSDEIREELMDSLQRIKAQKEKTINISMAKHVNTI